MNRIPLIFFFFLLSLLFALPAPSAAATETPTLEDIEFSAPSPSEEQITFKLNGTYIPKIFAIKGKKPRVVFDFPKTRAARTLNNLIRTNGRFIKQIRIGIHRGKEPKTRVVLDLFSDKEIDFTQRFDQQNNALTVTVFHAGSEPAATEKNQEQEVTGTQEKETAPRVLTRKETKETDGKSAADSPVAENKPETGPGPLPPAGSDDNRKTATDRGPVTDGRTASDRKEKEPGRSSPPVLEWVKFDNSSNRGEMIQFKLNDFYPPIVFGIEEGLPRVVCDFKDTVSQGTLKGTIKTNGRYVRTIRIGKHRNPDKIRVVIDLEPNNNYDLQQVFFKEDNLFVIIVNTMNNTPPVSELEKPLSR